MEFKVSELEREPIEFDLESAPGAIDLGEEAEQHLRRATELDPTLARAPLDLGIVLRQLGRPEEALAALGSCAEERANRACAGGDLKD